ncbi:MAG: MmcQ/YjbR family DNA-binding protein [Clostridia bacterium]|nr:MmcQ/YjbR family DNA-binding protein [Clostridia bacterium]
MPEGKIKNRKPVLEKLIAAGFTAVLGGYERETKLEEENMCFRIFVSDSGEVCSRISDADSDEEYVLHKVKQAEGAFVGRIREIYESEMENIVSNCFEPDVFKTADALFLLGYVKERYGDTLEFLWEKLSDNAVLRRKDNRKWYAAMLPIRGDRIGLNTQENVEIIDLRLDPEEMESTIDHKSFFPGYHMNKKHWYSILLDGSVPQNEIARRIDESYRIAGGKKKNR